MDRYELRDLPSTRLYLLQGLWLQRALPPTAATVRPALDWALELAAEGHPLPPVGFVADVGHVAFGLDGDAQARAKSERAAVPGLPPTLMRTYEDHLLGKLYVDRMFARASDALRHYPDGAERERQRGLAFLLNQFRERAGFAGVDLNPAAIKALLEVAPEQVLAEGWESLDRYGLTPLLVRLYESIVASARRLAEVLAEEDAIELERRTVLAEFAQHLAFRQVLQAARILGTTLPRQRFRPPSRRQEVPTRMLDEDTYPVGGFSSLSTRGSIESLLHSQLAFMEKDERPDLFDAKFLRDELLYYARDENQFLRRRRTFAFVFYADLVGARFKDASLPYQRLVLVLALLLAAVRKASEWLSTDGLRFEFLFVGTEKSEPLAPERELLEMLLREQMANGTVRIERLPAVKQAAERCSQHSRRSLCHCLLLSTDEQTLAAEDTVVARLRIDGPYPSLHAEEEELIPPEIPESMEGWSLVLQRLLQLWM